MPLHAGNVLSPARPTLLLRDESLVSSKPCECTLTNGPRWLNDCKCTGLFLVSKRTPCRNHTMLKWKMKLMCVFWKDRQAGRQTDRRFNKCFFQTVSPASVVGRCPATVGGLNLWKTCESNTEGLGAAEGDSVILQEHQLLTQTGSEHAHKSSGRSRTGETEPEHNSYGGWCNFIRYYKSNEMLNKSSAGLALH